MSGPYLSSIYSLSADWCLFTIHLRNISTMDRQTVFIRPTSDTRVSHTRYLISCWLCRLNSSADKNLYYIVNNLSTENKSYFYINSCTRKISNFYWKLISFSRYNSRSKKRTNFFSFFDKKQFCLRCRNIISKTSTKKQ